MTTEELVASFKNLYGEGDEIKVYFSPGRVNLIGEHIDYNGGFVFPGALTLGIFGATRKRKDNKIRFSSLNHPGTYEIDFSRAIEFEKSRSWANYPSGVISLLKKEGYSLSGADVLFSGNLPDGAGLSSSAAIEVLTGFMFLKESNQNEIDKVWLARFTQNVENQFIGVNCGIMDQFSVSLGKKNNAILLNCQTLEYIYAPFDLGEYSLVILNTNKRRELAESKYNERRGQCEEALEILRKHYELSDLCSATLEMVENHLSDPILKARARHVVSENLRVVKAMEVLKIGDLVQFGQLLKASHQSLRDDYEVTGKELDTITRSANEHYSCLGSRMTGAGFGGCAIAVVKTADIEDFINKTGADYFSKCGLRADFYISGLGEGVHQVS